MNELNEDEIVDIDKKELWEQMKKNSKNSVYRVSFEAIDTLEDDDTKTACFVDETRPIYASNFQHATLISTMVNYITKYIKDIETEDDYNDKSFVVSELMDRLLELNLALGELMEKRLRKKIENLKEKGDIKDE